MKRIIAIVLCLLMTLSLVACGGAKEEPAPEKEAPAATPAAPEASEPADEGIAPLELSVGHTFSTDSIHHHTYTAFKDAIEEASGGAITVEIFPSSTLGTETEMLEMVQNGALDVIMSGSIYANFIPSYNAVGLPYLYADSESLLGFVEESGWDILVDMFEGSGFTPISFWSMGSARSICSKDPIKSVADLNGMKIRCPESPLFVDTFKYMGANPTAIALGETYTSIQTGVADGCEMSPSYINDNKFYEVAPYYTLTNHFVEYGVCTISTKTFEGIDDAQWACIEEGIKAMEEYNRANAATANEEALQKMIGEGLTVIELDDAARQGFVDAVTPMYEKYASEYGDLAKAWIDAALAY